MFHYNNVIEKNKIISQFGDLAHMLDHGWKYFQELKEVHKKNENYYRTTYYLIDVYGVKKEKNLGSGFPLWLKLWNNDYENFCYFNGLEYRETEPNVWKKKLHKKRWYI